MRSSAIQGNYVKLPRVSLLALVEKGTAMKKTLMALVAVATLAVSTATPAHAWRGGWGPGIGLGLLGGAIIGGAIANSYYPYGGYYGPGYGYYGPGYAGGPYGPCYVQRQRFWDGYGWRARGVRVCEESDQPVSFIELQVKSRFRDRDVARVYRGLTVWRFAEGKSTSK